MFYDEVQVNMNVVARTIGGDYKDTPHIKQRPLKTRLIEAWKTGIDQPD
jgi:hypothetical protein